MRGGLRNYLYPPVTLGKRVFQSIGLQETPDTWRKNTKQFPPISHRTCVWSVTVEHPNPSWTSACLWEPLRIFPTFYRNLFDSVRDSGGIVRGLSRPYAVHGAITISSTLERIPGYRLVMKYVESFCFEINLKRDGFFIQKRLTILDFFERLQQLVEAQYCR